MIEPTFITAEMSNDFEEAVDLGVEAGISTVAIRSNIWGKSVVEITNDDVSQMKEILSKYEVRIGEILSPVGKCNIEDAAQVEQHLEIFRRMVQLAHLFDNKLIRIFPFRRPNFEEYESSHLDEYLELIVERLTPIVEIAEVEGVTVCLEFVGSTLAKTAQEIRRVVDALDKPISVGVVWEIDVAYKAGELPSEGYKFVKGLVRDVHLKPNPDNLIEPIGDSKESYEDAFRNLLADDYDGLATIEHWDSKEGTLNGIRQLKEMLDKIQ